jgi:CRP-like cAMP-binding protein
MEYLDNVLSGSVRRETMLIVDDSSADERLVRAAVEFGIAVESAESTLRRLLAHETSTDPNHQGLVLATVQCIGTERLKPLYEDVDQLADAASDALVSSTARHVLRCSDPSRRPPEEDEMSELPHIERVMFLQAVDPFSSCSAEQVLRLAAISSQCHLAAGEVLYRAGEPADALYCIIDGGVELESADGAVRRFGPRQSLGVLDTLSGCPRTGTATATAATHALALEAVDLFDLLADNIEIVKSLFRRIRETAASRRS